MSVRRIEGSGWQKEEVGSWRAKDEVDVVTLGLRAYVRDWGTRNEVRGIKGEMGMEV